LLRCGQAGILIQQPLLQTNHPEKTQSAPHKPDLLVLADAESTQLAFGQQDGKQEHGTLAEKLVEEVDAGEGEVLVDLEFHAVAGFSKRNFGGLCLSKSGAKLGEILDFGDRGWNSLPE
jgi:hypothetical protein